jgi:hypothetical protein
MTVNTKHNPDKHHRRSIRLCGYDYSCDGLYFITVCGQGRACLFGEIVDGEMILNPAGRMVEKCWLAIPNRYRNVILHEYVVMPNHFHAILQIDTVGATLVVAPDETVAPDDIGRPQGSPLRRKTVGQMVGHLNPLRPTNISVVWKNTIGCRSTENCGNAIITNISFAMPNRTKTLRNTSLQTLPVGRTIIFILINKKQ